MKKIKKEIKGITLVALVVTIIVLLILSGVAISLSIGEDGIFKRAQDASKIYENASQNELIEIEKVSNYIDNHLNGENSEEQEKYKTVEEARGKDFFEKTDIILDKNGKKVVIPENFRVTEDSEIDVNKGIVIEDKDNNQFVWINVENPNNMYEEAEVQLSGSNIKTNRYSKIRIRNNDDTKYVIGIPGNLESNREPDLRSDCDTKEEIYKEIFGYNSADELAKSFVDEYNDMISSLIKYNGFYVGRYELTGNKEKATEKKGKVLNNLTWHEIYNACHTVINSENVKSTMIYGCQWDEIINWLLNTGVKNSDELNVNSDSWGNYFESLIETGSNEKFMVNKIFDLAGNASEWTQEASTELSLGIRIDRGGVYYHPGWPASDRDSNEFGFKDEAHSSRCVLIIK